MVVLHLNLALVLLAFELVLVEVEETWVPRSEALQCKNIAGVVGDHGVFLFLHIEIGTEQVLTALEESLMMPPHLA